MIDCYSQFNRLPTEENSLKISPTTQLWLEIKTFYFFVCLLDRERFILSATAPFLFFCKKRAASHRNFTFYFETAPFIKVTNNNSNVLFGDGPFRTLWTICHYFFDNGVFLNTAKKTTIIIIPTND